MLPSTPTGDPAISICIVSGRRSRLLSDCLESLLVQQDAPSYEVLVCANGDPEVVPAVHEHFADATVVEIDHRNPTYLHAGCGVGVVTGALRGDDRPQRRGPATGVAGAVAARSR